MAHNKTMFIAKINIEMERPHSPKRYAQLLNRVFKKKKW
ncbi:hypothetical protein NBRC106471_1897 [Acetobacter pasteurianus subsp. pasteurianus LMG 1262 = NBRC 106471]|nr:hypothetical protein NBRC106471_1897 [Acetobacter pasteurianus subsp. pasteurianus LMG 1262 = NBRC 106471]